MFPTADRRFDTKVKCPTGWALVWVKFPTVRSLTRVKCPGVARGGMGGFGIDWYINCFPLKLVIVTDEFAIVIEVTIFSCDAVKLAECVRSGGKEDELEKHVTSYTSR